MGVAGLWPLLDENEVGSSILLSECSGQAWAVDLSTWVVQGRTGGEGADVSAEYTMMRTVFYRALCLLRHGIKPVIVMDNETAPAVKADTLNERHGSSGHSRLGLRSINSKCRMLLEALGLKVVVSSGEAEKTCALLNSQGVVDACLTDDGDAFLYGAKVVYRNFEMKNEKVERHTISGIQEKLGLGQRDLVVMALLSGCDYGSGVQGIGPKKFLDLMRKIKTHSKNALERVQGWRENKDLEALQDKKEQLPTIPRDAHCRQCLHTGTVKRHAKSGCSVCGTAVACKKENQIPCPCKRCRITAEVSPYDTELGLREKALQDHHFPDRQVVQEFLKCGEHFPFSSVSIVLPSWEPLMRATGLGGQEAMRKLVPILISMHLHGTLTLAAGPLKIWNETKQNHIPCYKVMWQLFDFDTWTEKGQSVETTPATKREASDNPYFLSLPQDLFARKYPQMVQQFKASLKKPKSKKPKEDPSQQKLTSFFKPTPAKRKLFEDPT